MSAVMEPETATPKKHKKEKSAKKRAREEEQNGSERKHKRSKSVAPDDEEAPAIPTDEVMEKKVKKEKKEKKEKKHKKSKHDETNGVTTDDAAQETIIPDTPPKSSKKKKSKRQEEDEAVDGQAPEASDKKAKKKKSKREPESSQVDEITEQQSQDPVAAQEPESMDIDSTPSKPMAPPPKPSSSSKTHSPPDMPPSPQFPFFNQTVSLYEPLLPSGWAAPISGCESQHLRHLHNRYVPSLRGVLLDYSRVTLNEKPGRDGGATADVDTALLSSKAEFGGGFGWITADVKLFIPSRGAWMEGSINLQTEGHVGVVCFGRFNASIEASRLPPSWKWVPNEQAEFEETASVITGADEHGVKRQIHSTGYWVDEAGDKVKGRVRFRIRNFDVGVSGNSTFLSLQGTMLDKKGEKALVAKEAEEARSRSQRKGGYKGRKRAPEFSMTRFESEEEGEAVTEEPPVTADDVQPQGEVMASTTANGDDGDE